jgi:hypothetical protein
VPTGIVEAVDTVRRTISVRTTTQNGDQILRNVQLMMGQRIPAELEDVVAIPDGTSYWVFGRPFRQTQEQQETNAQEGLFPGDEFQGDPENGPCCGVYGAGMAKCLATPTVGFVASKADMSAHIMGDKLYRESPSFHERIETDPLDGNISAETLWFGAPLYLGLTTIEMEKRSVDTRTGQYNVELTGWQDVSFKVKRNLVPPQPIGSNVSVEVETLMGTVAWTINGTTGELIISGAPVVKINTPVGGKICLNTDGNNWLDGVVTGRTRCPYTGGYHTFCSPQVFAGGLPI